uniref:Phosphatidylinositol-specific phospholipase C X domain-containing protein n=1 Tax=Pseudo-nitzschia delicatissima TaxID=44447 RepID=A0A7S0TDG6_9STRA|mmetsp:Transcript_374/g.786  ORF Transcript_374/g.786 Transcript_374/m.786 type:complete len:606 (+) Transcript_374:66-1883(+)
MTTNVIAMNHKRERKIIKMTRSNSRMRSGKSLRNLFLIFSTLLLGCFWTAPLPGASAFRHNSCSSDVARQFQFNDCYLPDLADDLLLSEAGFVMSHDSATGYLKKSSRLLSNGATNLYAKNQIGDAYQQLDDGARALDVRPKLLTNGTVVLHHGALPIAVTLEKLVSDARSWAVDNPDELVLILHSNFAYASADTSSSNNYDADDVTDDYNQYDDDLYNDDLYSDDAIDDNNADDDYSIEPSAETTVEALSEVYDKLGVKYVECSDLYELTVGEAKELAQLYPVYISSDDDNANDNNDNDGDNADGFDDEGTQTEAPTGSPTAAATLPGGGYLLAMDRHDYYASSCAKENWVEDSLVTCYSTEDDILPCTDRKSVQHRKIKEYALASANNEPSDSNYVLGPPGSTYDYPFNEIQALWQVDGVSAALGMRHVSSIIDDNTKSHLNARVVDWVYNEEFKAISLLAVDQVRLNGNALTSVLRNRCGQSELSYDLYDWDNADRNDFDQSEAEIPCGTAVRKPNVRHGKPLSTLSFFATVLVCMVFGLWIAVGTAHYKKHHDHQKEFESFEKDLQEAMQYCGCGEALEGFEGESDKSEKHHSLIKLPAID